MGKMTSVATWFLKAAALILVCVPAWATVDGPDFFSIREVAPNDVLYIREKPTATSPKLGQVPHDARGIRNLGCRAFLKGREVINSDIPLPGTTHWCRVHYKGVEGWANGRFLAEDAEAHAEGEHEVELRGGASTSDPTREGPYGSAAATIQAQIRKARLRDPIVNMFYGDLSGQGTKDAIAFVYHQSDGNSHSLMTWIWRERNGTYTLARTVPIKEVFGQEPRNVKFSPGRITVTTTVPKPDDPRCCPTGTRTFSISAQ